MITLNFSRSIFGADNATVTLSPFTLITDGKVDCSGTSLVSFIYLLSQLSVFEYETSERLAITTPIDGVKEALSTFFDYWDSSNTSSVNIESNLINIDLKFYLGKISAYENKQKAETVLNQFVSSYFIPANRYLKVVKGIHISENMNYNHQLSSPIVTVEEAKKFLKRSSFKVSPKLQLGESGDMLSETLLWISKILFRDVSEKELFIGNCSIDFLLPIIVSGLRAPPNSKLLIQYPELTLNGYSITELVMFLAKVVDNKIQVIVESKSDVFFYALRVLIKNKRLSKENVTILFESKESIPSKSKFSNISMDENGELSDYPIGLFDCSTNLLFQLI